MEASHASPRRGTWNKGKLLGQKTPFKLQEIGAVRIRLQMQDRLRDLALFDLGIANYGTREEGLSAADLPPAWRIPAAT